MSNRLSYQAGQWLAAHRGAAFGGVLLVAVGAASLYELNARTQPQQLRGGVVIPTEADMARTEQQEQAQKAAAEAQQAKCAAELPAAEKLAAKHLKQGDPSAAEDALRICDKYLSAAQRQLQTQAAQARVKQWQDSIAAQEKNRVAAAKKQGVSIGMSEQQVLESNWGKPRKVNTTTTANMVRQQWVYDGGYLYFENGTLRSIQN